MAGTEEGAAEREEGAVGVVAAMAGGTSIGADKPSAEKMLTVLVAVTVIVTTSTAVDIGEEGEIMSRRPGTVRARQEQMSSKSNIVNRI